MDGADCVRLWPISTQGLLEHFACTQSSRGPSLTGPAFSKGHALGIMAFFFWLPANSEGCCKKQARRLGSRGTSLTALASACSQPSAALAHDAGGECDAGGEAGGGGGGGAGGTAAGGTPSSACSPPSPVPARHPPRLPGCIAAVSLSPGMKRATTGHSRC